MQEHLERLESMDVQVIAASSDDKDAGAETVEELGLSYTVLYGLDPESTSEAMGCYTGEHDGEPHIQPTSFVLDRDGAIAHAVYSSGKVGRLSAEDAIAVVEGLRD